MIAQPANTLSAGTLALSGLWIARRNRQHRHARLVGAVVAAAGLGSVAYHGPGGRAAGWAHDATIAAMLGVITLEDVREVRPDLSGATTVVYASAVAGVGALLAVRPHTVRQVTALLAGAAVGAEISARRLARGDTRRAHRTAEALMAAALAAYAAGRTESRACRPDSWIQAHGLWHTLSGAAMAAWADAALREA
ncbi:MAG: hypothetical protein KY460_12240 [Actinobacteria bacterium]|nr:hypothetical protein [Actinomycetota bacterium]